MNSRPDLRAALVAALLLAAAAGGAGAQETIAPDRPGIGSASTVISPGILQLETGLSYAQSGDAHALSIGQLFLRYGLTERVELEILANSFVSTGADGAPVASEGDGLEDLGFGAKARLVAADGATLSLQGIVTAPTGADGFSSGEWYGTLVGLLDVAVGDRVGVGVNLGVRPGVSGLPTVVNANVTPGMPLGDGFGVYGGWAGTFVSGGGDVNWLEAGGTVLLSPDVQLDLNGAMAADTDDWFLGAGLAVRWGG